MTETDSAKQRAALAAAALVTDGMTVGLGSGTTAALVIRELGARVRAEGLKFTGVPTSELSAALAHAEGIKLVELDALEEIDLDIDGADEVDPQFRMIKGRGGALLREKIVAAACKRRAFVVGANKLVERLGTNYPVPVEVSPFGLRHVERALQKLGAETTVRVGTDGQPMVTDGGHRIVDCRFGVIDDPNDLDRRLHGIVGVFETGLFLGLCDLLVIGRDHGAEVRECPPT